MGAEPNWSQGPGPGGRRPICLLLLLLAMLPSHMLVCCCLLLVAMLAGGLENAIFHKGNGLETPSSEFSGLRMRDGVPSPASLSCARPDRVQL